MWAWVSKELHFCKRTKSTTEVWLWCKIPTQSDDLSSGIEHAAYCTVGCGRATEPHLNNSDVHANVRCTSMHIWWILCHIMSNCFHYIPYILWILYATCLVSGCSTTWHRLSLWNSRCATSQIVMATEASTRERRSTKGRKGWKIGEKMEKLKFKLKMWGFGKAIWSGRRTWKGKPDCTKCIQGVRNWENNEVRRGPLKNIQLDDLNRVHSTSIWPTWLIP